MDGDGACLANHQDVPLQPGKKKHLRENVLQIYKFMTLFIDVGHTFY